MTDGIKKTTNRPATPVSQPAAPLPTPERESAAILPPPANLSGVVNRTPRNAIPSFVNSDSVQMDPRLAPIFSAPVAVDWNAVKEAVHLRNTAAARAALVGPILDLLRTNLRYAKNDREPPFAASSAFGKADLLTLVPAPKTYGKQSWKWDLIFGALVCRELAATVKSTPLQGSINEVARGCVLSALQNQVADGPNRGMVPHMNFRGGDDAKLWRNPKHSCISQPPVVPIGVRVLVDPETRAGLYPAIREELRWWLRERMDEGLVFVVHPWETGRDASRDHDSQLLRYMVRDPGSVTLETKNPGRKDERSKRARFALLESLQRLGKDPRADRAKDLYCLKSPDMAALLVVGLEDAAALAREANEPNEAREFLDAADTVRAAVNDKMWDEASGMYLSVGKLPDPVAVQAADISPEMVAVDAQGRIAARLGSSFVALAAGIPNEERALRMLETLTSSDFFTEAPLPTVAVSDPGYVADDYWRGSTWININYLVTQGLLRYAKRFAARGDDQSAMRFVDVGLELAWRTVQQTSIGFFEYYASDGQSVQNDEGCGPKSFTWSALSLNVLGLIDQLDAIRAEIALTD